MIDEKEGGENNIFSFDVLKTDSILDKEGILKENGNTFTFTNKYIEYYKNLKDSTPEKQESKYFVEMHLNNSTYIGEKSDDFKKETYGYQQFKNGDIYLGNFKRDKKDGFGIYFFNNSNDFFFGDFKDNEKKEGFYYTINSIEGTNLLKNFVVAFGNFLGEYKIKIYENTENQKSLYIGKITEDGKKNDDNAKLFRYTGQGEEIFCGKIKDDEIDEGRFIKIDSNNEIKFYSDNSSFDYSKMSDLDSNLKNESRDKKEIYKNEVFQKVYEIIIEKKQTLNNFQALKDLKSFNSVEDEIKHCIYKYLYD